MIEIKICSKSQIDIYTKEFCTHFCIAKENEHILGYIGLGIEVKFSIVTICLEHENENILDGMMKAIVHYANNNNYKSIYCSLPLVSKYINQKEISFKDNIFNVAEFIDSHTCGNLNETV